MKTQKKVSETISQQFSGVTEVEYEGSEEYPGSGKYPGTLRVFMSVDLELNHKDSKDKDNGYDPQDIEQWALQTLQKTFKK